MRAHHTFFFPAGAFSLVVSIAADSSAADSSVATSSPHASLSAAAADSFYFSFPLSRSFLLQQTQKAKDKIFAGGRARTRDACLLYLFCFDCRCCFERCVSLRYLLLVVWDAPKMVTVIYLVSAPILYVDIHTVFLFFASEGDIQKPPAVNHTI